MNLASISARIDAQCPNVRKVGVVADLALLLAGKLGAAQFPAAFIVPENEVAGPNETSPILSQRVEIRFAVVSVIRNVAGGIGEGSVADLGPIREEIFSALLNWQPDVDSDPVEFEGGQLGDFDDSILYWVDIFKTSIYRRA